VKGFHSPPWLRGRHLQTVSGALRPLVRLPLRRERLELPDGDFLDLDWLEHPAPPGPQAPLLLVLHGLEGSSQATYARGLLEQARQRGWAGVCLNFRSCSGEPNRLLRSYHSGVSDDLERVVARLRAQHAGPLFCAGVSLGANVLVKWLGEQGEAARGRVQGAVAISAPFDLDLCARSLDGPGLWAFVYRRRFLRTLVAKARAKALRFPAELSAARLARLSTLRAFDDVFTAPVHGFAGAADYYARCSSGPLLPAVRVPLLVLSALDDPFIPPAALPVEAARANPLVTLALSESGGHVGFVDGPPWRLRGWAEARAGAWLEEVARAASGPPTAAGAAPRDSSEERGNDRT
jgi:predicted alpha/beta-fold hydrolase